MPAGGLIDPSASVDPASVVTDSVVGAGARIGPEARVDRSVVLPGASVAPGSRFREQVIGLDGRPVW
jgi:NDP-sugar pyrophosphorylase family protein